MRAGIEELAEIFSGLADGVRIGDADAVEAEGLRFPGERALELDWREFANSEVEVHIGPRRRHAGQPFAEQRTE